MPSEELYGWRSFDPSANAITDLQASRQTPMAPTQTGGIPGMGQGFEKEYKRGRNRQRQKRGKQAIPDRSELQASGFAPQAPTTVPGRIEQLQAGPDYTWAIYAGAAALAVVGVVLLMTPPKKGRRRRA